MGEGAFAQFKLRSMSPADNRSLKTFESLGRSMEDRGEFGDDKGDVKCQGPHMTRVTRVAATREISSRRVAQMKARAMFTLEGLV